MIELINELFENHGATCKLQEEKLIVESEERIRIRTRITPNYLPSGQVTTRFDIGVKLENGQELFEAFGDIGNSYEQAVHSNFLNFMNNSFHVILNAFQNTNDEQVSLDEWEINAQKWKVFIGKYGMRSGTNADINIPIDLYDCIVNSIHEAGLKEDVNFIRFFMCNISNKLQNLEFMINNENLPIIQNKLSELNWEQHEEYYSVRLFMIAKKTYRE